MRGKLSGFRLVIPQEVREKSNLIKDSYVEVTLDKATGNIIVSGNLQPEIEKPPKPKKAEKVKKSKVVKAVEPEKEKKKPYIPSKKIEANFMDADKLYTAIFSECGLVARTKTKYVNNFCEKCRGQLAAEWENRVEVRCKYLSSNFNAPETTEVAPEIEEEVEVVKDIIEEPKVEIKQEEKIDVENIRKQRKADLENISKSIKDANKVIDNEIEKLKQKPKSKKGRPKKQKRYSTGNTTIKPVRMPEEDFAVCKECGQFVKGGFLLDDEFLCKTCALNDFKEFLERRGN